MEGLSPQSKIIMFFFVLFFDMSPEETLMKSQPQFGKSGRRIFSKTS